MRKDAFSGPGLARSVAAARATLVLASFGTMLALAGCFALGDGGTTGPFCPGPIQLEISKPQIFVGDEFQVTATGRGEECDRDFTWTVDGVIRLLSIEGQNIGTFLAEAEGDASITVRHPSGVMGKLEFSVEVP